jgi:flagellar motor switch protein FliN/FliY
MTARQTEEHTREEVQRGQPAGTTSTPGDLSRLGDIEVRVAVEVGAAELLLRDVAALGPGAVVRLDRLMGDPAELTVNGRLFARGDLVVVGDRLGLRITDLTDGGPPS